MQSSLYGAMGYLAMAFSMQLICYCLEMDIRQLQLVVEGGSLGSYLVGGIGSVCSTAITSFVGCGAMKAVPEMASMVFPGHASHGAAHFIGGMQSTAAAPAKMAIKYAMKS